MKKQISSRYCKKTTIKKLAEEGFTHSDFVQDKGNRSHKSLVIQCIQLHTKGNEQLSSSPFEAHKY